MKISSRLRCKAFERAAVALFGLMASFSVFAQTLVVGHTPGEFSVSPTGAVTYRIPIAVPPGVAGMVPNLSLNYSSQAEMGIAGLGWSLEGSSTITRCPLTRATDGSYGAVNLNGSDRFCLDGQRLLVVSGSGAYGAAGSEYRTEIDQFSRITANGAAGGSASNGPESFTVRTKDGRVLQFGTTADSRIEAQGKTVVAAWALASISDVKGNTIGFGYTEDAPNGTWRLASIGYAGGKRSVHLHYEVRPDVYRAYRAGSLEVPYARLARVETRIDSTVVHNLNLSYDAASNIYSSRLISAQLCDRSNSCLSPTMFGWTSVGSEGFSSGFANSHGGGKDNNITADFNGDGRADMAGFKGSAADWHVCLASGGAGALSFDCSLWQGTALGVKSVVTADYNGDGRADIAAYTGTSNKWAVCLSTGSNFQCSYWYSHSGGKDKNISGDFNGDGRTDMAYHTGNGVWSICLSTGTAFSCSNWNSHNGGYANNLTADFNGDGLADMLSYTSGSTWRLCTSTSTGFSCSNASAHTGGVGKSVVGDFNGDGLKDIAGYLGTPGSGTAPWKVCLSTGTNFSCSDWTAHNAGLPGAVGDYNGDGRTDLAAYSSSVGQWRMCLSNGTNFECSMWSGASHDEAQGDYNGDGIEDFAAYTGSSGNWRFSYSLKNERPLIKTITRGGVVTAVEYHGMSALGQEVYTKESWSAYPFFDVQAPIWLVRSTSVSNGAGGSNTTRYHFGGMRAEHAGAAGRGRGNQGFRWSRMYEEASKNEAHAWYAQDWPFTGQLIKSETRHVNAGAPSGLLRRTETQYKCYQTMGLTPTTECSSGVSGLTYHVWPQSVIEKSWDFKTAVAMPEVQTWRKYDGSPLIEGGSKQLGDATELRVDILQGGVLKHRRLTANEYHPAKTSGTDWQIGRLKRATVTSEKY